MSTNGASPQSFLHSLILRAPSPPCQLSRLIFITRRLAHYRESCHDSLELPQPGVSDESSEDGRQVAQGDERVVDGGAQVVVPAQEALEVQDQECFLQRVAEEEMARR